MAMRAPSCARRTAIPRPIPRLPPVISATRLTSGILLLANDYGKLVSIAHSRNPHYRSSGKRFLSEYHLIELSKPRNDHRHIVRLLRRACPLFRGQHKRLANSDRLGALHANRRFLQPADAKFLTVHIFWLDQSIAVLHQ